MRSFANVINREGEDAVQDHIPLFKETDELLGTRVEQSKNVPRFKLQYVTKQTSWAMDLWLNIRNMLLHCTIDNSTEIIYRTT